jgi:outer membrane murein-binding lipoprotein Lpp
MWKMIVVAVVLAGVTLAGCTGANPYRSVDLSQNLDQATLDRYENEWKALQAAGHTEAMVQLERSNWWPLGLIAYHRDCSVTRMAGPGGTIYHVTSGHGFGPLSLLYTISTDASFTANGERVNWMRFQSALTGCLMMSHETDANLADGREEHSSASHWVHHVLNIHSMDGHTYVSLFTLPNPIGVAAAN